MKIYAYTAFLNETGNPYIKKGTSYQIDGRRSYSCAEDMVDFIYRGLHLHEFAEEYVYCLCFDSRQHLIGCFEASHGSVGSSFVSSRELFQKALMIGAVSIVLTHNHPGNDPTPSGQDIAATKMVQDGGNLIGVKLLDHIVVCRDGWVSLFEKGLLKEEK